MQPAQIRSILPIRCYIVLQHSITTNPRIYRMQPTQIRSILPIRCYIVLHHNITTNPRIYRMQSDPDSVHPPDSLLYFPMARTPTETRNQNSEFQNRVRERADTTTRNP